MPTVKAILRCCCGCFKKAGDTTCGRVLHLTPVSLADLGLQPDASDRDRVGGMSA